MKHYTKLHKFLEGGLFKSSFKTIQTNKKKQYINLSCGFDIETSSVNTPEKSAFMYIWMIGFGSANNVYYGRTWDEFLTTCELLQTKLKLSENKRLVVYVHNLGYEFQFMRKYFTWLEVFAVSERKPIKAFCSLGIEFRDSYILSGFSLANTAKNLTTSKVTKLEGDLDYQLIRHHTTKLTDVEKQYCKNDVVIIIEYINEQISIYKDITKIPTTNTGRVRNYVRRECYYSSTDHKRTNKSKYCKYRRVMSDLTLDVATYTQLKRAFMGGFTHANANHTGKVHTNVTSIDFTSSYPATMVSERFPMSRFKPIEITDNTMFTKYLNKYAMVFDVKFINLKCKLKQETYFSESKAIKIIKPVVNNGRVTSADELIITLTEIDFEIVKSVYTWECLEVSNVKYAHKNYLPKSIVKSILDLYQDKTMLKDVKGSEVEYLLSKGMLNSIYGMCVTDIIKDNVVYDTKWGFEKVDIDEAIEDYNNSKTRFLYYAWGLWVTAYARRNLWTGIIAVKDDYIYSDTDSLKLLNYQNHKPYIEEYNKTIYEKMKLMTLYFNFNEALLSPKTIDGVTKTIGYWDYEGTYYKFKTLGAKRYIQLENGKIKITIAGLSKQNGKNYMVQQCKNNKKKVFDMFNDELFIPSDDTGKMTHTYIDHELKFKVQDYQGVKCSVNPLSGIHLEKCEFTLSISDQYKSFVSSLTGGFIFKGAKQI